MQGPHFVQSPHPPSTGQPLPVHFSSDDFGSPDDFDAPDFSEDNIDASEDPELDFFDFSEDFDFEDFGDFLGFFFFLVSEC